ncbi:MAG: hypothetical protein ACT4OM_05720 [Actinomycetota bacterium]
MNFVGGSKHRLSCVLLLMALAAMACGDGSPGTDATATPAVGLTVNSAVGLKNVGPVVVGMTLEQLQEAAGVSLVRQPDYETAIAATGCAFMSPGTIPGYVPPPNSGNTSPLAFMIVNNSAGLPELARIDILAGGFRTNSGIQVGSTEQEVQTAFGNSSPLPPRSFIGPPFRYLTATPRQAADANFRLVFESDGARVVRYRAGRLPEVLNKNGCNP